MAFLLVMTDLILSDL